MDRNALHRRIVVRFAKVKREMQQLINDVQWWNENRTDADPMDCEPEQVFLSLVRDLPDDPTTWEPEQNERYRRAMNGFQAAVEQDRRPTP
jgi:hypothetical protein